MFRDSHPQAKPGKSPVFSTFLRKQPPHCLTELTDSCPVTLSKPNRAEGTRETPERGAAREINISSWTAAVSKWKEVAPPGLFCKTEIEKTTQHLGKKKQKQTKTSKKWSEVVESLFPYGARDCYMLNKMFNSQGFEHTPVDINHEIPHF